MNLVGDPNAYELAYRAGLQAVDEQAAVLRETRDRAGSLLSAAAVAGGLAAGLAFSSDRAQGIGTVGAIGGAVSVVGFAIVVVTTVLVWLPAEGRFSHDAGILIGSYVEGEPPAELPEVHRELALWLGDQADANRRMLGLPLKTFTVGLIGLLIEISGAIIALGDVANG